MIQMSNFKRAAIHQLWATINLRPSPWSKTCPVSLDIYIALLKGRASKDNLASMLGFDVHDDLLDIDPSSDFMRGTGLAVETYDETSEQWLPAGEPPVLLLRFSSEFFSGLAYRSANRCIYTSHYPLTPIRDTLRHDTAPS